MRRQRQGTPVPRDRNESETEDAWNPEAINLEVFARLEEDDFGHKRDKSLGAHAVSVVREAFGKAPATEEADSRLRTLNAACLLLALDEEVEAWSRAQAKLSGRSLGRQLDLPMSGDGDA